MLSDIGKFKVIIAVHQVIWIVAPLPTPHGLVCEVFSSNKAFNGPQHKNTITNSPQKHTSNKYCTA